MKALFLNPITYWLRWLFMKWKLDIKYRKNHLYVEYMAEISNCTFGHHDTIYKFARLRNVDLGNFGTVARNAQVFNTKMGHFSGIGPFSYVGLGEHPSSVFVSTHPLFYSTNGQPDSISIVEKNLFEEYKQTYIGNDVITGNCVIIKQGVTIGNGAIIAAGSVVRKDVEPYSIVGGVPAKHIRYRFTKEQIDFLQEFKWWDRDLDWIIANKDLMVNVELLMEKYGKKQNSDS